MTCLWPLRGGLGLSGSRMTRAHDRRKAGHCEILGETYAKFEFFENGWNPYSRFLDVDKVDLILRRNDSGRVVYREVQVKYGKLFECKPKWERMLFDFTTWRFFDEDDFADHVGRKDFFVAYVVAPDAGPNGQIQYQGDIFIFPVGAFVESIRCAPSTARGKRRVCISRLRNDPGRWFLRRTYRRFDAVTGETCLEVSQYRRNFGVLLHEQNPGSV